MSKTNWNILGAAAVVIILMVLLTLTGCDKKEPLEVVAPPQVTLEVGQVWQGENNTNPFENQGCAIRKIIALKDGYVQYLRIDPSYGANELEQSMIEDSFRFWSPVLIDEPIEEEPEPVAIEEDDTVAERPIIEMFEEDRLLGGSLKWVSDGGDKGHLEYYSGDDWIALPKDTEPIQSPVWGQGELPADFAGFFGTDNSARLNKAQNDMLNRHQAVIHGLDQVKDGKKVHANGLVDMILNLDNRVKALEAVDPNEVAK